VTADISPGRLLWEEHLHDGAHWSGVLRRGTTLRLTDLEGGGNVAALMYNHEDRTERYCMADTLKAQHTAYLTRGCVCYSDMGRVLCSLVEDSCGWHDAIGGLSNAASVAAKYGVTRFQEQRNGFYKNGYDSILTELRKYGLGRRDIVANISFFSKVTVGNDGQLLFRPGNSPAGAHLDLRFEMHTLVAFSSCQHPLDPEPAYRPRPIRLTAFESPRPSTEDPCRTRCPENGRGFVNTERVFL